MSALDPAVRAAFDATPIAHVATVDAGGAPHVTPVWVGTHDGRIVWFTGPGSRKARNLRRDPRIAVSVAPADDPFSPVLVRGRVVEWIDGEAGWAVVDVISRKYTGSPYPRDQERVVAVVEPDVQRVGLG